MLNRIELLFVRYALAGSGVNQGGVIGFVVDLGTYYLNGVSRGTAFTSTLLAVGTDYPYVLNPYYTGYSLSKAKYGVILRPVEGQGPMLWPRGVWASVA